MEKDAFISKFLGPLLFKQDDIHFIFKVTKELSSNSPEAQYIEGYLHRDFIQTLVKRKNKCQIKHQRIIKE